MKLFRLDVQNQSSRYNLSPGVKPANYRGLGGNRETVGLIDVSSFYYGNTETFRRKLGVLLVYLGVFICGSQMNRFRFSFFCLRGDLIEGVLRHGSRKSV